MTSHVRATARMKVPEFLAWADAHLQGSYELVDGEVVGMAPERQRHNIVKLEVVIALRDAVRGAGRPCNVFTDGIGVVINDDNLRIPDAVVQCGRDIEPDSLHVEEPLIVVEVASPSTARTDTEAKLIDYFSVASIQHYLIVHAENRVVIHHRRNDGNTIDTRIVHEGDILFDPPGISVPVAALLGPLAAAKESH